MADDMLEGQIARRNARKKEQDERRAEKKAKGLTRNNKNAMPVMSKVEQARKLHELKAKFLTNKRLEPLVTKLFDIAMDDDHDGQMQAIKLITDRILPTAGFSGEQNKSSAVQINITGLQVAVDEKPVNEDSSHRHQDQVNGDDVVSIQ